MLPPHPPGPQLLDGRAVADGGAVAAGRAGAAAARPRLVFALAATVVVRTTVVAVPAGVRALVRDVATIIAVGTAAGIIHGALLVGVAHVGVVRVRARETAAIICAYRRKWRGRGRCGALSQC